MMTSSDRLNPVTIEFWLPQGPDIAWQVVRLEGVEGLSRAYEFVVELATDDPTVAYEEMLGADAELLLDRNGMARSLHGVIVGLEALMSSESRVERAVLQVRVTIVPAFALLDQQLDTRFFQGQSVVEIAAALLGEALGPWQRSADTSSFIKGTYPKRDYCVQFRETTFAFLSRILEE
jgi:type VI secretion system secreted protein VgrG